MRESLGQTGGMVDGNLSLASKGGLGSSLKFSTGTRNENNAFERVQNFEEAFNKIKSATGITDIEELVRTFIKNEDHNFSLFNYVNEQNNEVEKLEEQIQTLREEERKFVLESGEDFHQHKQVLKVLENKLQTTDSMAEKYEIRCQDLQRVIESLRRGIQSIYEKFNVGDEKGEGRVEKDLGQAVVTESNMVHYLGLIEQRANLLLQSYSDVKQTIGVSSNKSLTVAGANLLENKSEASFDDADNSMGLGSKSTSFDFAVGGGGGTKKALGGTGGLSSVLGTGPKVPMGQDMLHVSRAIFDITL
jgi:hypothetical protein